MPKDRELLKGLDELLDGAGNRFGPMLLDELQDRLSITVKKFDLVFFYSKLDTKPSPTFVVIK